jgi:excinuclease ABC subunit C
MNITGVSIIETALSTMPGNPGVYRMLDLKGEALYVGKARNLAKRVASYTQVPRLSERIRRMVSETAAMEIITTHTEAEALLLEANLIKKLKPRFNILLRDDKSYPWLMLTEDHPYPQISKHRGAQVRRASYWGPFASAWSVSQTVQAIQRVFLLRTCADTVFSNRTRPCLLYQIKRCSAPCVGRISDDEYGTLVAQAKAFLSGKSSVIQKELGEEMHAAAAEQKFERAAAIRDRLRGLAHIQGNDVINPASLTDADVIALHEEAGQSCVQVFFIRGGRNNGNRSFFPTHAKGEEAPEILAAFIAQFYDDKPVPPLLLLSHAAAEQELLEQALSLKAEKKITLTVPQRGEKHDVVVHAQTNAREALERRLAESAGQGKLLAATAELFGLEAPPARIEVYDNSHIMGTSAYGVMVVAGAEGFEKSAFRKFAIKSAITPGDDFGMMREVLRRRFGRAVAEGSVLPDLVLIDGGAGQFSAAAAVVQELGVEVKLVAIAKGPDRDAGREWFFTSSQEPFQLPPRDPVLYFLQRLRDEAHRFAITTHRNARSKKITVSELDEVPGIGAARKKALLTHFGSARGVKGAGLKDLEAVSGINKATARAVYAHFHPGVRMDEG